jgi:hypothetical protein
LVSYSILSLEVGDDGLSELFGQKNPENKAVLSVGAVKCRDTSSVHESPVADEHAGEEVWATSSESPIAGRISTSMEELERMRESELMASDEVRECLKNCLDCYQTCTETTIRCLALGGKHSKLAVMSLLMDCATICNLNADFMLRNSNFYPQTCGITADICDECADVCERFDDDFMKQCASVCRRCAESCREMAR